MKGMLCVLCLCLALLPLPTLTTSETGQCTELDHDCPQHRCRIRPQPPPAFFACENETDCTTDAEVEVPSLYMGDVLEAGYRHMREIAAAGRRPLVVQVGADGLQSTARWTDSHLVGHIINHAGLANDVLRFAFVEPVAEKERIFWKNIGALQVNRSQVLLVEAMMEASCPSATRSLFRISASAGQQFNISRETTGGWVSMEKDHPFAVLKRWVSQPARKLPCLDNFNDCRESWTRFAQLPNMTDYYDEIVLPCYTLADLLEKVNAEARDLAMLVVDAESNDQGIVASLASDPDFAPGFVMWEGKYKHGGPAHEPLCLRGYDIGSKPGVEGTGGQKGAHGEDLVDNPNTVAVRQRG